MTKSVLLPTSAHVWLTERRTELGLAASSVQLRTAATTTGPVVVTWFVTFAGSGLVHILKVPEILVALNPLAGLGFALQHPWLKFVALGSVVLALTGAEALYADMGHFGAGPVRLSWFALVLPALTLNYFGQGALLLARIRLGATY